MPRYHFNIRITSIVRTRTALTCQIYKPRGVRAKDIADIVKTSSDLIGIGWSQWSIEVCDGERKVLLVVPFSSN